MTAISPPAWTEGGSNHARQARLVAGVFGAGIWGSVNGTTTPLKVTGTGTSNATISAGGCYVSAGVGQGVYACYNDANVVIAIPGQGAGSARTDLIVARVYDSQFGDVTAGSDYWQIERVDGSAGAPSVPAAPARSLVLAQVTVNASGTTIASVTDKRAPVTFPNRIQVTANSGQTDNLAEFYAFGGANPALEINPDGSLQVASTGGPNVQVTPGSTTADGVLVQLPSASTAKAFRAQNNSLQDLFTLDAAGQVSAAVGTASFGPWSSYVPALTASTTNPTIGAGSISGRWKQIGKTVFFEVQWTYGSGATLGSGTHRISLPAATSANIIGGAGAMVSATGRYRTTGGSYVPAMLETGPSATYATILVQTPGGTSPNMARVTNAVPASQSSGDQWIFSGFYEVD